MSGATRVCSGGRETCPLDGHWDLQPPTNPCIRRLTRPLLGHTMTDSDVSALVATVGVANLHLEPTPVG